MESTEDSVRGRVRWRFRWVGASVLFLAASCPGGGAPSSRAPTSYPPGWPHRAPWKLNRELLTRATERIEIVVDAPRGTAPRRAALDHLVAIASKYGERPASWERLGDPRAPRIRWVEPERPPKLRPIYVRLREGHSLDEFLGRADNRETIRYLEEVPACPDGALPDDVSYVFVRYVGTMWREYGAADEVVSDRSCGGRTFPVVWLAQTSIAQGRPPGIGETFLEERALAHEYGHVLGLGSNPSHGWWADTRAYRGGAHCVHPECAVAVPSARALLKGEMLDYCVACRHDIEEAREYWRMGKEFPESPRLPQRDPAADVASLKNYNFRDGGDAEELAEYGKRVMPALLTRISELPGGSGASPRAVAARIALRIVVDEDTLRRPAGVPPMEVPVIATDLSGSILAWWQRESEAFMGGDAWELPKILARHGGEGS